MHICLLRATHKTSLKRQGPRVRTRWKGRRKQPPEALFSTAFLWICSYSWFSGLLWTTSSGLATPWRPHRLLLPAWRGTDLICQLGPSPGIKTHSSPAAFPTTLSLPFVPFPSLTFLHRPLVPQAAPSSTYSPARPLVPTERIRPGEWSKYRALSPCPAQE